MTHHLLHASDVRSVLYQMGGKGMAQGVGRDVFFYAAEAA